jgi:UDP-glucuronate 4-epimerase
LKVLVTGAAGFIGAHVAQELLEGGSEVIGCDSFNDYYSPSMKLARVKSVLSQDVKVYLNHVDDFSWIHGLIESKKPDVVVHLAAQPGVRYSSINPEAYLRDNITGTWNVLLAAAQTDTPVVYASSSSVYGEAIGQLDEKKSVPDPISLYACTKRTNELMARQLNHTHGLRSVGLRFFTVYGPWGRPDMAVLRWINNCLNKESISITGKPTQTRDATYIDDVARAVCYATYSHFSDAVQIVNVGGGDPHTLSKIVTTITDLIPYRKQIEYTETPKGDVSHTWASTVKQTEMGFPVPTTDLLRGVQQTVEWARGHSKDLTAWIESSRHGIV